MPSVPHTRDDLQPIPAEWNLRCIECGYELTGLRNRVCPECGHPFSPRETWEANQAQLPPRSESGTRRIVYLLALAGVVAVVMAIGGMTEHVWAALVAAVVILAGELWIGTSEIRPLIVRLFTAALSIFIAMFAAF